MQNNSASEGLTSFSRQTTENMYFTITLAHCRPVPGRCKSRLGFSESHS